MSILPNCLHNTDSSKAPISQIADLWNHSADVIMIPHTKTSTSAKFTAHISGHMENYIKQLCNRIIHKLYKRIILQNYATACCNRISVPFTIIWILCFSV